MNYWLKKFILFCVMISVPFAIYQIDPEKAESGSGWWTSKFWTGLLIGWGISVWVGRNLPKSENEELIEDLEDYKKKLKDE